MVPYVVLPLHDGQRAETMSPDRKFDFLLGRIALCRGSLTARRLCCNETFIERKRQRNRGNMSSGQCI